jgi:hypothetical protein
MHSGEEADMQVHMRFAGMLTLALASAFTLGLHAQEAKTQTKVKGDDAKTVTYTGCVQPGNETKTFVLAKAVPIRRTTVTEETGTSGVVSTTTSTTYALVPSESVELQPHLGRKVEITGIMNSGGEMKTETKTKSEAGEKRTEEKVKGEKGLPQFHVLTVKELGESCS